MNYNFFHNKVAVVTGAGSGMGRSMARQLAGHGCHVALSDINADALAETVDGLNGEIYTETLDVADREAFFRHAENVKQRFGPADIIINNAGVSVLERLAKTTGEDFNWVMNINFWGVVNGTQAFLSDMIERGSGTVVNMSSINGLIALPSQGAYTSSKFAVRGFTECLRLEMLQENTGVHVVCVHPGVINTNIAENTRFYSDPLGRTNKQEVVDEFKQMAGVTPDQAAEKIIKAIVKNQPRVLIGKDAHFIERVQRWRPVHYARTLKFVDSLLRKRK